MKQLSKTVLFLSLLSGGPLFNLHAESASEINQKHYQALLKDLQSYMETHPEAEDLGEARMSAIEAAHILKDPMIVDLLKSQYTSIKTEVPLHRENLLRTGMMLTRFAQQYGREETSRFVLEDFKA